MKIIEVNGDKIKQARKHIGMTLGELSDRIHLSITQISYIENGHRNTSEETLRKIVQVLNKPLIVPIDKDRYFIKTLSKPYSYNYFLKK